VATLTLANLAVAVGFAVVSAATISPFFKTSFAVILGRTLVLAAVLLACVHRGAAPCPNDRLPGWLPRWLLAVLAVGVAAPLDHAG
jgi:hypothetical protein